MPGDIVGVDANGMPMATRILGSYTTPPIGIDPNLVTGGSTSLDPNRISGVLSAAGVPSERSRQVGQAIAQNVGQKPALRPLREGEGYAATITGLESLEIPLGQMMLEAQASAAIAANQLSQDVRNIEANNSPIVELNRRSRDLLKEFSGQDLGPDREAWERWVVDLAGYAFSASQSSTTPPPTITEQIPLEFQPQATPFLAGTDVLRAISIQHSCFGAGTLVCTLDGPRPIEDIRDGDQVLTQNTSTGALSYQPVLVAYHNPPNATYRIVLGRETLLATGIHRFWTAGKGWTMTRDLKPGDRLRAMGGIAEVKAIETDQIQPVFNLQLTGGDSFFVGQGAILAHDNSLVNPVEKPFDAPPPL
jgi:hypothetical protein